MAHRPPGLPADVELRHLRYFAAVAQTLNFNRAAEQLGIAQPPLSQQIRQLEQRLGVVLLERTTRKVALTTAGRTFLAHVGRVLEAADHGADDARRADRGEVGRLRVGFVTVAILGPLGDAVRQLHEDLPELELDLVEAGTTEQIHALQQGQLDVGIGRVYGHDLTDLDRRLVWRGRYMLALPAAHRLARRRRLRLDELAQENWVMFARHTQPGLYDAVLAGCAEAGFTPRIVQHGLQKPTVMALVRAGLGVALIPSCLQHACPQGVVMLELSGPVPNVELTALWPRRQSHPAAHALVAAMGKT